MKSNKTLQANLQKAVKEISDKAAKDACDSLGESGIVVEDGFQEWLSEQIDSHIGSFTAD